MKFNFKAKNISGEMKEGVVEAADKDAAVAVLQKNKLFPIFIREENTENLKKVFLKYFDRVTEKEKVIFFRQLSVLIEAKVPIITALVAINDQSLSRYFKEIIGEVIKDIEDGATLADALFRHPDTFSPLIVNIIRAGESSGNLVKSVSYIADNIERNYTLSSKVKSAMAYPAVVMVVFLVIGFLVMTVIVPRLVTMIKDLNAEVPWYTKILISGGEFMGAYWWAVLILIVGIFGGFAYYLSTEEGKKEWDYIKLKIPVVGPIFRYLYISRFAENLSVLLSGGIPIIKALGIVSSVVGNRAYEKILLKTAEEVKLGGNMSDELKRYELVPSMVAHMIKIGEESGQVDSVLNHINRFYSQEVDVMTKSLSTLIEPILMIIIGIGVGFLTVGVLMPIYNIASQIK